MEIVVEILDLAEILPLHFVARLTLEAVGVWNHDLVDYDVPDVDVGLGQLLAESFSFVHRQVLGNTDCYELAFVLVNWLVLHW